jgi:hypothetical protein
LVAAERSEAALGVGGAALAFESSRHRRGVDGGGIGACMECSFFCPNFLARLNFAARSFASSKASIDLLRSRASPLAADRVVIKC